MIKTNQGLPNNCSKCGKPQTGEWYAENEQAALAGQGLCAEDAGVKTSPAKTAASEKDSGKEKGKA